MTDIEIETLFKNNQGYDHFRQQQIEKRGKFFERVHAAFVLNTSLNEFGIINDSDMGWLLFAYPQSEIKTGNDQGATYYTITPKF